MRVTEDALQRNNENRNALYHWYKAHGICPYCGTRYPEPGRVHCAQCLRRLLALRQRRDPGNEQHKKYNREYRERKKAAGLCVDCGKGKAMDGKTRCARCAERMDQSRTKYNILKRMDREAEEAKGRNV